MPYLMLQYLYHQYLILVLKYDLEYSLFVRYTEYSLFHALDCWLFYVHFHLQRFRRVSELTKSTHKCFTNSQLFVFSEQNVRCKSMNNMCDDCYRSYKSTKIFAGFNKRFPLISSIKFFKIIKGI